jgi:hypothetical protein
MAELKIKADSGGGTVSFKGPATTTSNAAVQLTLPVDDGTANQYLKTDGSGALSWATVDTSIADDSITEAKLDVSNGPTNGLFLQANSGGGGLTWAAAGKVYNVTVDVYGGGNTAITSGSYTDTGHTITAGGNGGTKIIFQLFAKLDNSYSSNIIPHFSIKLNDNSNTSGGVVWRQNQYDAGGQNIVNITDHHATSNSTTFKVRGYQSSGTSTTYLTGATLVAWEV